MAQMNTVFVTVCLLAVLGCAAVHAKYDRVDCPAKCKKCIGDDGPCCGEVVDGKAYCSQFCLVPDYICCGCFKDPVSKEMICGGCPKDNECINVDGDGKDLGKRKPGRMWYCSPAPPTAAPHTAVLLAAALLAMAFAL
eukprot:CAMPEP_0177682322 /NCGR_PEP_ID=MMETSP0447-20121125/31199_1 /TAXON_ID=0 /ORGANISM="Stygamoeba regulata, Strain BSH-02190019" /LENGTH=137 /DNA_ID=CAMNT_0019191821 /DNA_START=8 /DNA_END=421 /DNA_ORIENTATION=+